MEYDITVEEKTLKLVFVGKIDLLEDGASLTDGKVYDFSPLDTQTRILFYVLLLALPVLAFALNAHWAVMASAVCVALCGAFLVTFFSLRPVGSNRKKLYFCIGTTAVCYAVCAMMWAAVVPGGL